MKSEEAQRLRAELEEAKRQLAEINKNKSAEMDYIIDKFTVEKVELERGLSAKQKMIDQLLAQIEAKKAELERLALKKDEEIAILQAGMDQSLLALDKYQQSTHDSASELQLRLEQLRAEQLKKLEKILGYYY